MSVPFGIQPTAAMISYRLRCLDIQAVLLAAQVAIQCLDAQVLTQLPT